MILNGIMHFYYGNHTFLKEFVPPIMLDERKILLKTSQI